MFCRLFAYKKKLLALRAFPRGYGHFASVSFSSAIVHLGLWQKSFCLFITNPSLSNDLFKSFYISKQIYQTMTPSTVSLKDLAFIFFHLTCNSIIHTFMKLLYWFTKPASMIVSPRKYKSHSDFVDSFQHVFISYSLDNAATERNSVYCLLYPSDCESL